MKPAQTLYNIFVTILTCLFGVLGGILAANLYKDSQNEHTLYYRIITTGITFGATLAYGICFGLKRILRKILK